MKRPMLLGLFFLLVDQMLKYIFQINFSDKTVLIFDNLGFTYTTNPGIWLKNDISGTILLVLQIAGIFIWLFIALLLKYYHAFYRRSILIDLSFAFFTTAIFGNSLDHFLLGYVRDYFINPIAISNFADICGTMAVIMLIIEIILFPKARSLLKMGKPSEWIQTLKKIYHSIIARIK